MRHEAIYNIHSNVVSIDDKKGAFDKDGNKVNIDESKVTEKLKESQAKYDAQEYARDRASAFPSIGDQLDMLFHDMTTDKGSKDGEWYKAVAKVKEDNPKPDGWKE